MSSERTEEATPRKLRRARQDGRVWRSRDLTSALILLAASGLLIWAGGAIFERLRWLTAMIFGLACAPQPPSPSLALEAALEAVVDCLWPLAGVVTVTAVTAGLVQVWPLLTFEPVRPKLARLDPIAGLRRLLDGRGVIDALVSAAKVLLVGAVLVATLVDELPTLVALVSAGPVAGLDALAAVGGALLLRGGVALLGLAALDVLIQRRRYLKDMRMTRREVERERRETEGDESLRGERRRLRAELLEGGDHEHDVAPS